MRITVDQLIAEEYPPEEQKSSTSVHEVDTSISISTETPEIENSMKSISCSQSQDILLRSVNVSDITSQYRQVADQKDKSESAVPTNKEIEHSSISAISVDSSSAHVEKTMEST